MSPKFGFSLLELCAIAAGCLILLRPSLFTHSKWLRYAAGILLIGLALVHICGYSLLNTQFR